MSQDQKFQQRWEFRRVDDDHNSSSNDTKSSSGGEPMLKRHKLVSNLILPGNDEISNIPVSEREGQLDTYRGMPFEFEKPNIMHTGPSNKKRAVKNKKKRGFKKNRTRKKNKPSMNEPILVDDLNVFMKSTIEELKVAREKMFTLMKEEMKKFVAVELASRTRRKEGTKVCRQHQNNVETGEKTINCNGGSLEKSVKSDRMTNSTNCYEVIEKQVNHDNAVGTITSMEKEKIENLRLSAKKPIYSFNHLPEQVVSSPYLTLPTVLSKPQAENHRLDSSCNYTQPGAAQNKANVNLERAKLLIDASTHRFGSFSQTGSTNLSSFDHRCTQTSTMGTGFPIPLHQGLGNGFHIPSQAMENSSRENIILQGLRMTGGAIRFSGGSRSLSEHFVSNNLRSQMNSPMNYQADGGPLAFGNQDQKDNQLYPN